MPTPQPTAADERVAEAIWFGLYAFAIFMVLAVLTSEQGRQRLRATCTFFAPHLTDLVCARIMSRWQGRDSDGFDADDGDDVWISREKRNGETGEIPVATGKGAGNDPFQFPDGFTALARLIVAGKLGETDALKLAVGASPGKSPRYIEARQRLHAAMEREQPSDHLTPIAQRPTAARFLD